MTIGTNYLATMLMDCQLCGHRSWSQPRLVVNAPQPNEPDASDITSTAVVVAGKNDMPFQSCKKMRHHVKSALAPELIWIK